MSAPVIKTPRGQVYVDKNGKAVLEWNTSFQPKMQRQFTAAQKFVDSEVLRLSEPFVPHRTGMLIQSGILGTQIGSGTVKYIAPYAHRQYYLRKLAMVQDQEKTRKEAGDSSPLRGPYWFERMKRIYWGQILAGARKYFGAR